MMPRSRRAVLRSLAAALLVTPLLACSDPTAPLLTIDDVTYAPSLNVDLAASTRPGSGLAYQDLTVGPPAAEVVDQGRVALVRYSGYLVNGAEFDSNEDASEPLPVAIGIVAGDAIRTIPGFELGLTGMRVGGTRKIVIPPALAYGQPGARDNTGRVIVPGNAVIVFDVELVGVR